ncbi:unnamed protein product [Chondrus crispus]|uniref:Uncharacterized protein n=1 Tax=Chondrus crispus TaxID=2769 RepID=R7QPM5_CHOCR|nr:unnamed protein product [Chondrus crispus]CDF39436.1 unnamed protein product [Chondrus crispus]|eukprot:XP_005719347.1 unnamed protein product [Chondrus crispus]
MGGDVYHVCIAIDPFVVSSVGQSFLRSPKYTPPDSFFLSLPRITRQRPSHFVAITAQLPTQPTLPDPLQPVPSRVDSNWSACVSVRPHHSPLPLPLRNESPLPQYPPC